MCLPFFLLPKQTSPEKTEQGTSNNNETTPDAHLLQPTPLCCTQADLPAVTTGGRTVARGAVGGGGCTGLAGSGPGVGGGQTGPASLAAVRIAIAKDTQRARCALLEAVATARGGGEGGYLGQGEMRGDSGRVRPLRDKVAFVLVV